LIIEQVIEFGNVLIETIGDTTPTSGAALLNVKDGFAIAQSVVTMVGITFGAIWAYAVFYFAGNHSTAVQIQLELKQLIEAPNDKENKHAGGDKGALISVKVKNIGRVRVDVDRKPDRGCRIESVSISKEELLRLDQTKSADIAEPITNTVSRERRRQDDIFQKLKGLEPDEETAEDVLFLLDDNTPAFKVEVRFHGLLGPGPIRNMFRNTLSRSDKTHETKETNKTRRTWATRAIFVTQGGEQEATTQTS
jgi:hypothetical protein